ncbi:hypothetical protein HPB50_005457 [Hyalomma asiaticum]|uniref:Uncharacterized protein n=1 Tax=Hyalomma asiaticum TaxID=266040 RepID=A0ACB7STD2_HYAAI|nr:hypothetical protein HPB50_005457 [Hyalomma asiaticum]
MIVEITVPIQGQMVRNIQEFRWTDWEEFRSKRQALSSDDPITDIEELQTVNNVSHTIYADDITIWSIKGSDGQIETALQKALEVVEDYLAGTGLRCSPKKSELLLYRPTLRGRPPKGFVKIRQSEEIQLHTKDGVTIPIANLIMGEVCPHLPNLNEGAHSAARDAITRKASRLPGDSQHHFKLRCCQRWSTKPQNAQYAVS